MPKRSGTEEAMRSPSNEKSGPMIIDPDAVGETTIVAVMVGQLEGNIMSLLIVAVPREHCPIDDMINDCCQQRNRFRTLYQIIKKEQKYKT